MAGLRPLVTHTSVVDSRATPLCCALSGQLSRPFPAAAGQAALQRSVGAEQLGRDPAHRTRWEEELLQEKDAWPRSL